MTTDCTPGIGATGTSHDCTLGSNAPLGVQDVFFACNSTNSGEQTSPLAAANKANMTIMTELRGTVFDGVPTHFNGATVGLFNQKTETFEGTVVSFGAGNYTFNISAQGNYTTFAYTTNVSLGGASAPHIEVT
jgi:hypothetical protein